MTQKWIVFAADATQSQINWWLARNKDACGYFTGIPPFLQAQADEESWTLPHIWIEEIPQ
jgi:hypothetical protein